ncbi:MAG TPA: hypothetical protein ENN55_02890 [Firmicutes bacterium]|nr:hypothetical protein [Bacillota bacterium]
MVFEGGYEDFLERIGWDEEEKKSGGKNKKNLPRKDKRHNEKTKKREMAKLRKRIEKTENTIMASEKELEDTNAGLVRAIEEKDTAKIRDLGRRAAEISEEIKEKYAELEKLMDVREECDDEKKEEPEQ